MMKYVFSIAAILLFTNYAFGCSLLIAPVSHFDTAHYIFIGEVVGVIQNVKFESRGVKGEAVGFKVKVSENIHSPKQATYFEVYPLRLTSICGLMSDTKVLLEQFSVGSQVRVVAKETTMFKNNSGENSIIRLDTSIYSRGSFSKNGVSENLKSSATSIYDYSSFAPKQRKTADDALVASNDNLPVFELRKDLLRLKESKSEDEKIKIAERLVFYPYVYNLDYLRMVQLYVSNQDKFVVLQRQWEQRVKEIDSKTH